MPTYIYSKQDFISWLDRNVKENQVIVFTNHMTGSLSISKRSGLKITHVYSEDVFQDGGVGHIAFGKSHPIGVIVTDKELLSDNAASVLTAGIETRKSESKLNREQGVQECDATDVK